jgi:hypothetical protein
LTYANVIATLCLFLLLGGGAAFAATQLPKNSVGPKQLKKNAVTSSKIKNGSVATSKLSAAARTSLMGQTGPQGPQGAAGPSNAYYAHGIAPNVTGLPAGDYVVHGQLVGEKSNPSSGSVFGLMAYGVGVGESGQTPSSMATFAPGTTATIPFQAIIHLPQGGAIGTIYTSEAVSTEVDITVIRVGSATP